MPSSPSESSIVFYDLAGSRSKGKARKPRDPTICEQFNTYRFADYKEAVSALLRRVVTVSVETMKIVEAMAEAAD